MSLIANVERWRPNAIAAMNNVATDTPNLNKTWGYTQDALVTFVLGIWQRESQGNNFILGDHIPGQPTMPEDEMISVEAVTPFLDYYNSIGGGQLNFGAKTPQGLGYAGDKAGLLDPDLNLYYTTKYFLTQLNRYNGDVASALSAYNAGHSIQANISSYVNVILSYVKDLLTEKKILG